MKRTMIAVLALCTACRGTMQEGAIAAPAAAAASAAETAESLASSCWQVQGGRGVEGDPLWSAPLRLDPAPGRWEGYRRMTPLAVLPPAGLDSTQVGTMWTVREGSLFLVSTYGAYRTIVDLKVSGETAQGRLRHYYDVVDGSPNPGVPVTARRVPCERQGP